MVTVLTPRGLIVSTGRRATAARRELIDCCGWPILLRATPQRLRRELRLAVPGLTLFWLDPLSDFATAIQLIAWLAASQSAVRRVVIAHRLSAHVEVTIRSAGAQLFLAVDDNVRALVKEWMPRWVDSRPHLVAGSIKPLAIARSEDNFLAPLQATLLPSEPP